MGAPAPSRVWTSPSSRARQRASITSYCISASTGAEARAAGSSTGGMNTRSRLKAKSSRRLHWERARLQRPHPPQALHHQSRHHLRPRSPRERKTRHRPPHSNRPRRPSPPPRLRPSLPARAPDRALTRSPSAQCAKSIGPAPDTARARCFIKAPSGRSGLMLHIHVITPRGPGSAPPEAPWASSRTAWRGGGGSQSAPWRRTPPAPPAASGTWT